MTKRDLKELEKELKTDIEKIHLDIEKVRYEIKALETKTQTQIELMRRDLKIWFGGMLVLAVGVLSAVITLVPHLSK